MSSLDFKIVLLLHESSRAFFSSFWSLLSNFVYIFNISVFLLLHPAIETEAQLFSFQWRTQAVRKSKLFFPFPGKGQSPPDKTELKRMKTTSELYFYCNRSSSGAHNTGISHAVVS